MPGAFLITRVCGMDEKGIISASEIGTYIFCPRAWALEQLDYEPDNQYEMDAGKEIHKEFGEKELERISSEGQAYAKNKRMLRFLSKVILIVAVCLVLLFVRLILK